MRYDALILAQAATVQEDTLLNILGAGVTRITPNRFPWQEEALTVITRYVLEDADLTQDQEITLAIYTPSDERLAYYRVNVTPDQLKDAVGLPGEIGLIHLIGELRDVKWPQAGTYRLVSSIGDSVVGAYPLVVAEPAELELVQVEPVAPPEGQ